jgi:hypothetical protein
VAETVATAVLEETQAFVNAAVPEPVKVVFEPTQAASVPIIVGLALIIMLAVTLHPLELV